MAKRRRAIPARKPRDRSRDDDSLLLRSAESLGRVIGALQRQLDAATKRLATAPVTAKSAKATTTRLRKTLAAAAANANDKKRPSRPRGSRKTATRSRKTAKKR